MTLPKLLRQAAPRPRIPHEEVTSVDFWRDAARAFAKDAVTIEDHIREGVFSGAWRCMAGASSILAGLEVSYEHYRGSYGQKIMWTPRDPQRRAGRRGRLGALSPWAARTVLRWTSAVTLLDGVIGFCFHVRGIARKPGGLARCRWRIS